MGYALRKFELEDEIENDVEEVRDLNPASATTNELYQLGLAYWVGRDVNIDYVVAHKWFNLAAMQGSAQARTCRAELAAQMTADQVASAQRLAREWLFNRAN